MALTTLYPTSFYEVSNASITKYYYFNGAQGAPRIAMRQNGILTYLHADHLGSTVLTTDSSGNTVGDERYYAYGRDRGPTMSPPTIASPAKNKTTPG